jgi:hypothetical protein
MAMNYLAVLLAIFAVVASPQSDKKPSIAIKVVDEQGGLIVGASATLTDSAGHQSSGTTNQEGKFVFPDLPFGNYGVRVNANQFTAYESPRIQIASTEDVNLNVTLRIAGVPQTINVFPVGQLAEYVGGTLVIRGEALVALDGPGGLEAFLRSWALRTSGPFGPLALVNGFEDVGFPPTSSIREIRISDNPLSAEYSALGLGRIEILTKPGTDQLHGSTFGILGDANINSRNPFAPDKAHFESRMYGGNLSGPLWRKHATFFLDFARQQTDANAVINATIVGPAFNIVPLRQTVVTPQLGKSFSSRVDFQAGAHHTFILRYADSRSKAGNSGVGEFSLLSRAQSSSGRVQTFQLTETAVLNSRAINEVRFQVVRTRNSGYGNNSSPAINVPGAFTGGGADIGAVYNRQSFSELQNITTWQGERHILKFGVQGRLTNRSDGSTQNFGGAYTFAPRVGPQLDSNNDVITDAEGAPVMMPITTIEAYRRTLLFRQQGLSAEAIRELGGGPSQFSIATGQIGTTMRKYNAGAFLQTEWKLRPNFTLSPGVRYERQSDVSRTSEFAPRMAFAWGLGKGKATVVRGGVGIFYERLPDSVVLRAKQMDGVRQRQYFVSENSILDLFPAIPTPDVLAKFLVPQTTVRLAKDLRAPYTLNSSLAVERQLLPNLTVAVTGSRIRSVHLLRSRNISAPLGTVAPSPVPAIFQYESSGVFDQRQLLVNAVYRAGKNVTLWSTYTLSDSKGDTDSPDTFPANSYNLRAEYSRSSQVAKHTIYWGGWIRTKFGIQLTPLVLWRSQIPFDITTGVDANGDSLFTERPAFATDLSRPSVIKTRFGVFDLNPLPGQTIIPRNYGSAPSFFIANLRAARQFPLTKKVAMTVSVQGTNIFNHTNAGAPVGTLGSALFGVSTVSAGDWGLGSNQAGNRRLEGTFSFNF